VSLEQFNTQVLLLHSEQKTLDSLSTGFTDRYTVHFATTGSEALNTLGEAQIDVIVTAQQLPGMSGLEALREAKKRSPDTIGILLAGSSDEGLEALVGDKEVFQIVRGNVTPESLCSLIDNATQQARLLALSKSANDTSAEPDIGSGEHIVMETSDNGASIISDGTGTLPVLNPEKISATANVGSRAVDVLVLTKDEEFLATVKESSRGMHNVRYANTVAQADEAIRKHKVGVAVLDAAVLGDDVEMLTLRLRAATPRLVAIIAGRRDDGEMLMDLINRGKVYRFLLKPVSPGRARLAVEASVKHHLEAPDSAFKIVGNAAASKPAAPATPAASKEESKKAARQAAQQAAQQAALQTAREKAGSKPKAAPASPASGQDATSPVPKITVEPRPVLNAGSTDASAPLDDGLADAFGGDDTSFTKTMTGIVKSVGKSFGHDKSDRDSAASSKPLASGSADSTTTKLKFFGTAAAVLVIAALGWWLFGGSDETVLPADTSVEPPTITETEAAPETQSPAPTSAPVGPDTRIVELLEEARLAATAGQIFNPPGGNAIELYMSAAEAAPNNAEVAAELGAVIEQALTMAESSLLEKRAEDAAAALRRVGLADPDNARLPFLNAQLAQIKLRDLLDNARVAIRESRFEDAAAALSGARALDINDVTEIDVVADELDLALNAQQVEDVLAKANTRLEAGQLIAPSNDNARYYYELALSRDAENSAARQGLVAVASKLVLQARAQIDNGDFSAADLLLVDAHRLDPSSEELADAAVALRTARDRLEQERLAAAQQEADRKAAAKRAAAEKAAAERAAAEQAAAEKAAAERAAAERAAAEKAAAEKAEAERAAALKLAAEQLAAEPLATGQAAASGAAVNTGEAVAASGSASDVRGENIEADGGTLATANPISASPVAVRSLNRIKYVAPKYPRAAERRNLSGYVDIVFTVDIDGTVKDIQIIGSEPGETFVNAATDAVEDWKFEPTIEGGVAVEKRAAVRMMFAIE